VESAAAQVGHQAGESGILADGRRDEADLVCVAAGGIGDREDPALGERPHRPIPVTGPTVPAAGGTAAGDFHQQGPGELGAGAQQVGERWFQRSQIIGGEHRQADHRFGAGWRVGGSLLLHDRPVFAVADLPPRGDVESRLPGEAGQQLVAVGGVAVRRQQLGPGGFRLTHHDDVHERRQRLRIHLQSGAAGHHERVPPVPPGGLERQPGGRQELQHGEVVGLERHGERQQVTVARTPATLQRPGSRGIGRVEKPFAVESRGDVQLPKHPLEAEVAHPHRVGGRVDHAHQTVVGLLALEDRPLPVESHVACRITQTPWADPGGLGILSASRGRITEPAPPRGSSG